MTARNSDRFDRLYIIIHFYHTICYVVASRMKYENTARDIIISLCVYYSLPQRFIRLNSIETEKKMATLTICFLVVRNSIYFF